MQHGVEKPWNNSRHQHFICWLEEKDSGEAELFGACTEERTRQKHLESFHILEMKCLSFKSLVTFEDRGCVLRNACKGSKRKIKTCFKLHYVFHSVPEDFF